MCQGTTSRPALSEAERVPQQNAKALWQGTTSIVPQLNAKASRQGTT